MTFSNALNDLWTNAFNSFANTSNGHYKVNFSNGFTHGFECFPKPL